MQTVQQIADPANRLNCRYLAIVKAILCRPHVHVFHDDEWNWALDNDVKHADNEIVAREVLQSRLVDNVIEQNGWLKQLHSDVFLKIAVPRVPHLSEIPGSEVIQQLVPAVSNHSAGCQNWHAKVPRILGVHARVSDGEYTVGFVVVEGRDVVSQAVFPAPGESEARQLSELYTRAIEMIGNANTRLVALKMNEAQGSSALTAHRAEGVLMAAAGKLDIPVRQIRGRQLWNPAGLQKTAKNAQAVNALCGMLSGEALVSLESRQAAAAALVALLRPA
jgi:hypothetical protein